MIGIFDSLHGWFVLATGAENRRTRPALPLQRRPFGLRIDAGSFRMVGPFETRAMAASMCTEKSRMLPLARHIFRPRLSRADLLSPAAPTTGRSGAGLNRDGVWRETGIVERFASSQLTPKWRVEIGSGYCGPTVASGRVYVMDLVNRPRDGRADPLLRRENWREALVL